MAKNKKEIRKGKKIISPASRECCFCSKKPTYFPPTKMNSIRVDSPNCPSIPQLLLHLFLLVRSYCLDTACLFVPYSVLQMSALRPLTLEKNEKCLFSNTQVFFFFCGRCIFLPLMIIIPELAVGKLTATIARLPTLHSLPATLNMWLKKEFWSWCNAAWTCLYKNVLKHASHADS